MGASEYSAGSREQARILHGSANQVPRPVPRGGAEPCHITAGCSDATLRRVRAESSEHGDIVMEDVLEVGVRDEF